MKKNNYLSIFILSLLAILTVGCSQKKSVKKKKTTARFVLALGSANYPGGLYVAAYNVNTGEKFGKTFFSDSDTFTVANGTWKFAAIGWKGAGIFQGENRCELTPPFELVGEPVSVNLNLAAAKCNQSFFGPVASREAGSPTQFKALRVQNCMDLEYNLMHHPPAPGVEVNCDGSSQSPLPGNAKSYRILLRSFVGNPFNTILGTEVTPCRAFTAGDDQSPYKLPLLQGPTQFPMHIKVKVYGTASCTNEIETFDFPHGFKQNLNMRAVADSYTSNNGLYTHSNLCSGDALTSNAPYEFFHGGTLYEYIVCNGTQFTTLSGNGNMMAQAIVNIGHPINLSGESSYQIPDFNGKMIGHFQPITNSNETLVNNLVRQGSFEMMRVENATISGADKSVLVNNIVHATNNILEINFRDIEIINSSISSSTDNVGYIFGQFIYDSTNVPNPYDGRIVLDNIRIDNSDGSKIDGSTGGDNKGGLIGYIAVSDSNNTPRRLDLEIRHADIYTDIEAGVYGGNNTSNSLFVGGAIGRINFMPDPDVEGHIELMDVRYRGQKIIGAEYVGGLIGSAIGNSNSEVEIINGNVEYVDNANNSGTTQITCVSAAADANCGGIIGEMDMGLIVNSYTRNKLWIDPSTATTSNYGGLCGKCLNTKIVSSSIITRLTTSDTISETLGKVGGAIGYMKDSMVINSYIDVDSDKLKALHFGGVTGFAMAISTGNSTTNIIKDNVINGIHQINFYDNAANYYVGSIAGGFNYGTIKNNISYMDLNSDDAAPWFLNIGGFAGKVGGVSDFDQVVMENTYRGNITLEVCDSTVISGMAFGVLDNTIFNYNVASGSFNFGTNGTINGSCGLATGSVILTPGYTAQYDANTINVSNNTATLVSLDAGGFNSWVNVGSITSGTCTGSYSPPMMWDSANSECIPIYENDMLAIADIDNDGYVDVAGNHFDPIQISTAAEWNLIADTPAYLTKSYELAANIDFGDTAANFTPIGGNPSLNVPGAEFLGSIINPNGHVLSNIRINASSGANNIGVIRQLGSTSEGFGMVGRFLEPLIIDGLKINYDTYSPNYVGAIGFINDGLASIEVTNAEYYGTGAPVAVGGIAGGAKDVDIMGCLFNGDLGPISSSGILRLGGVVGKGDNKGSGSIHMNIEMCGVRLGRFHADTAANTGKAGGIIGEIPDIPGHYSIHGSYVHYEANGIITAEIFGGMIALIGSNTSIASQLDVTIGESYVYRPSGTVGGTIGQANALFFDGITGTLFYQDVNGVVLGNMFESTNGDHGIANSTDASFGSDLESAFMGGHPNFVWLPGENRYGLFFEDPNFNYGPPTGNGP